MVRYAMGALIMTSVEYTEISFLTLMEIEPGPSQTEVVCFNHSTKVLFVCLIDCFTSDHHHLQSI